MTTIITKTAAAVRAERPASWHAYHLGFDATYASENGWDRLPKPAASTQISPSSWRTLRPWRRRISSRSAGPGICRDQGVTLSFEAIGPARSSIP